MSMSEKTQTFVLHFGEMGSRWGINRTVGQIYAFIVISESPVNAEQIAAALSISRGNVSMSLKELQSWQLVKLQHVPGDRKEYYSAAGEMWDMGLRILEERRKREVEPTLTVLRDLLLEEPSNSSEKYAQERMQEIHDLLEMVSRWSLELQSLSPEKLRMLMKLGAGVTKVLDMKGKLLTRDK